MSDYSELKRLLDACRADKCAGPRDFRNAVDALFDVCSIETIADLVDENEALRKDAERWRFVRDPLSTKSPFAIWGERKTLFLGRLADSAIDAAMSREVQP